jgi:hypothetical protein
MVTEVMDAGVDSVGVGPAMFEMADVEIVTPYESVLIPRVSRGVERMKGTYNCSTSLLWEQLSNLYFFRSTSFPTYLFISIQPHRKDTPDGVRGLTATDDWYAADLQIQAYSSKLEHPSKSPVEILFVSILYHIYLRSS